MEEVWRDIVGYEGLYEVSNLGKVASINFGHTIGKRRELKQSLSSSGYYHVQLYKGGKSSTKLVHILVANAFCVHPVEKTEVNHIDGNKANNKSDNLEWVTRKENAQHALRIGLTIPLKACDREIQPKTVSPTAQYSLEGKLLRVWNSRIEAANSIGAKYVNQISKCARGEIQSSHGFIWRDARSGYIPNEIEPSRKNIHVKEYGRSIHQFDRNGNYVACWDSAFQIQKELGYNRNSIYRACSGIRKRAFGYIWRYANG